MATKWIFVTRTRNSDIYVDYRTKKTKIIGIKFIYYHDGIYPNIDHNNRLEKRRKYNEY